MKVQVSLDMSHNVYIYIYIKILIKSISNLIVFALLQTKLCNGGLMSHTYVIPCACLYFDASRDASNV
jgi:hypothetical protein